MKSEMDMLHGSLWNKILIVAVPIAASSILQQLFNSVDIAVVGKFAGTEALAAVGANSSLISLMINVFSGLSIGTNAVLAVCLGKGNREKAGKVVHTAVAVALVCGLFLVMIGQCFARQILMAMSTPQEILPQGILYLKIYFIGMPFIMIYNFVAAILRSKGDTKRPLAVLLLAGVINVILNLIFVIVFHMDVAGVAWATVLSNVVSASLVVIFLVNEPDVLRLEPRKLGIDVQSLTEMAKIGLPAGLQSAMFCFANVCLQSAINSLGATVMAATTASLNMEYMIFFIAFAFNQTTVTFVGQNMGAKNYDRCYRSVRWALLLACVIVSMVSLLVFVFAGNLMTIFSKDPLVVAAAVVRLRSLMPYELLDVVIEVITGGLRGFGHSLEPALACVIGACGLRIVWIMTVFQKYHTFKMLVQCYWVSWLVTGIALLFIYYWVKGRHCKDGVRING